MRYPEHFRDYKYTGIINRNLRNMDSKHAIGSKGSIMDIIHVTNRGKVLNTMEKLYIYKETKIDNQLNDKCTVKPRVIFDTVILKNTYRAHIALP